MGPSIHHFEATKRTIKEANKTHPIKEANKTTPNQTSRPPCTKQPQLYLFSIIISTPLHHPIYPLASLKDRSSIGFIYCDGPKLADGVGIYIHINSFPSPSRYSSHPRKHLPPSQHTSISYSGKKEIDAESVATRVYCSLRSTKHTYLLDDEDSIPTHVEEKSYCCFNFI